LEKLLYTHLAHSDSNGATPLNNGGHLAPSRLGGTFFLKVLAGLNPDQTLLCSITIKAKKIGSPLLENPKRAKKVKKFIPLYIIELLTPHIAKMRCIDFNKRYWH
jgi:hypothetical protein